MDATTRWRISAVLLVLAFVAGACSPGDDASTTSWTDDLAGFREALDPEQPIIEAEFRAGMVNWPERTVRLWSDGRYRITFGTVDLPLGGAVDALADVELQGWVHSEAIDGYLSALMHTDVVRLAGEIADAECPIITDAGWSRYTLTSVAASASMVPCAAWRGRDFPSPLDLAAELIASATDERREEMFDYLHYGSGLSVFAREDWTDQALVAGSIARIDLAEPRLAFVVDEILIGATERNRFAIVGDEFDGITPEERSLLEAAQPGDRTIAIVEDDGGVYPLGFLDASGELIVTGPSHSRLSLGHLGFVASTYELYLHAGVQCRLSRFHIPDPGIALDPLESLQELAERTAAVEARRVWVKRAADPKDPGADLLTVAVTGIAPDIAAIITDGDGNYLGHVKQADRTENRDARTTHMPVEEPPGTLQVWLVARQLTDECHKVEFGSVAETIGELLLTIDLDVDGDANEPIPTAISINLATGDYSVEP